MTDDSEKFEQMTCPDNVNWTDDIKQMFTQMDIDCMKPRGVDLSSYQSTNTNATGIYVRVESGSMPLPSSGEERWSTEKVNLFGCWIKQGKPENPS